MILRFIFYILLFFAAFFCEAKKDVSLDHLKQVLKKYKNQNVLMKIDKNLYIPSLNQTIKETGLFYLSKYKFRLQIQSPSESLIVFDGSYLWNQADLEKEVVLKSQANHSYFYLFSHIFSAEHFFKTFKVISSHKKGDLSVYHIEPIKKKVEIQKIILTIGGHVQKLDVIWSDLNNSQSYRFHKVLFQKYMSPSLFKFKTKYFKVIEKS